MAKNACLLPNADICQLVAKEYNISAEDAATTINNATSKSSITGLIVTAAKNAKTAFKNLLKDDAFLEEIAKWDPSNILRQELEEKQTKDSLTRSQKPTKHYITAAPYFRQKLTTKNKKKLEQQTQEVKEAANKLASLLGLTIKSVETTYGTYQSSSEISYQYIIDSTDQEKVDLFASLLGDLGYEYQDAVIAANYVKKEESNAVEVSLKKEGATVEDIEKELKSLGIEGSTYHPENGTITIFVDRYDWEKKRNKTEKELRNEINNIKKLLDYGYTEATARGQNSRYLDVTARNVIYRSRLHQLGREQSGSELYQACSKALAICEAAAQYPDVEDKEHHKKEQKEQEAKRIAATKEVAEKWDTNATKESYTDDTRIQDNLARIQKRNEAIKQAKKDIAELYPNMDETELDDMTDLAERMAVILDNSKKNRNKIIQLTQAFKDPRRVEFLGDWVSRRFAERITAYFTHPETYKLNRYASRQEVYKDSRAINLAFKGIRDDLEGQANRIQGTSPALAEELRAASQNLSTLLAMYGNTLFRFDGVRIGFDNAIEVADKSSSSVTRNDSTETAEEEENMLNDGMSPADNFSVSKQDQSVSSKIAPDIKRLLGTIKDTTTLDEWGYGLPTFLDVSKATNELLCSLEGCTTFSEMMSILDIKSANTPWIETLRVFLTPETDSRNYTGHAKEQLQSMFYKSFRKTFTSFRNTYQTVDKDGNIVFKNQDLNAPEQSFKMLREVEAKFAGMKDIPIIEKGKLDPTLHGTKLYDTKVTLETMQKQIQNKIRSGSMTLADCKVYENSLYAAVQNLGVSIPREVFDNYFVNGPLFTTDVALPQNIAQHLQQIENLRELTTQVYQSFFDRDTAIRKGTTTDTRETNPLSKDSDYRGKSRIYNSYKNLIESLAKYGVRDRESMAYDGGKSHYAWNNPSDIQTVIDHLKTRDSQKFAEYIEQRYQSDALWFLKPSKDNRPHFYSDWLESIVNGNGRNIIEYSEKLSTMGKTYENQSPLLYDFSLLSDYFSDTSLGHSTAVYRVHIFSDKPRYGALRFTRYSVGTTKPDAAGNYALNDYHTIIATKAADFFTQELRRAQDVAAAFGKDDIVKYKHYDLAISKKDSVEVKEAKTKVQEKIKKGKDISIDDVVVNGSYIFAETGAAFHMNKFLNAEIENKTAFGKRIIDLIFNTKDTNTEGDTFVTGEDIANYKSLFHTALKEKTNNFFNSFRNNNAFEITTKREWIEEINEEVTVKHAKYILGNLLEWHKNDNDFDLYSPSNEYDAQQIAQQFGKQSYLDEGLRLYFLELAQFKNHLEEYTYNNWLAKANMLELFSVDPAFYGNTTNFQKRNAQNISSGYALNSEALFNKKRVSDGNHRFITIKIDNAKSDAIDNIETALRQRVAELRKTDKKAARQLEKSIPSVLSKLSDFDSTDGQAYTSLTALRKHLIEQGDWTYSANDEDDNKSTVYTDEAVYRRFKSGNITNDDLQHVFAQIQKPLVFGFSSSSRGTANRRQITAPVQNKNSELCLSYLNAFANARNQGTQPASVIEAIQRVMEESADRFETRGIDTVNFDSAQKVGNDSTVIDLSGKSPQEAYEYLSDILYVKKEAEDIETEDTVEYSQYVHSVPEEGYKIQQTNPEHFKNNAQPIGSQMKILAANNIPMDATVKVHKGTKKEKVLTGKEFRDKYLKALDDKMKIAEWEFNRRFCLSGTPEARKRALSNFLLEEMGKNQKYAAELREALSITTITSTGEVVFDMPLDDEMTQEAAEAMIYSIIRRLYYKEKMPGGPVVQAASWGKRRNLHIRFFDKNGHILPTKEEWEAKPENKGKSYKKYCSENQSGPAYFEAQAPMPDAIRRLLIDKETGKVAEKYYRPNGSWDMYEIRKVVPAEYFDAICYRIPTESKYSMMPCRIVEFTEEAAGSAVFYPAELVVFSGSDFDIDKSFIELRPMRPKEDAKRIKKHSSAVDNELFDLQYAALQSDPAVTELFTPGDFSDMSEQSYYLALALSGNYTKEELDAMSPDELKTACEKLEDLDLLDPTTDGILHNQNSEAGQLIGMAAVGVASHAFFSLYNDGTVTGSTCMAFREKTSKNEDETFTLIDDSDPNSPEDILLTGYCPIDNMYNTKGDLIGTQISKFVGASADAAKEPALSRLNITPNSFPVVETLIRLGVSRQFACAFVAQRPIRDVIDEMKNMSSFGYANVDYAINKIISDLQQATGMQKSQMDSLRRQIEKSNFLAKLKTVRYSEVVENSFSYPDVVDTLKQLYLFKIMMQQSQYLRQLDNYPRYNSSNAMRGSSYVQRFAARKKLNRLEDSLKQEKPRIVLPTNIKAMTDDNGMEYSMLRSMFPHVGRTIDGENRLTDLLILPYFKTYNHLFEFSASILGIEEDADSLQLMHSHLKNYLLFNKGQIANSSTANNVLENTRDFPDWYYNTIDNIKKNHPEIYSSYIEKNSFINSIFETPTPDEYGGWTMLATDINNIPAEDREKYITDWASLLSTWQTKDLAVKTAIYFFTRQNGVRYSRDTPVHLMPIGVKKAVRNYTYTLRNASSIGTTAEEDGYVNAVDFATRFCLNNATNKKIVPQFNERNGEPQMFYAPDVGSIIFTEQELQDIYAKYTTVDDQMQRYLTPLVISIDGDLFLIDQNEAGRITQQYTPEDVQKDEKLDKKVPKLYGVKAMPIGPFGIPGQLLEYTSVPVQDGSVYGEHGISDSLYEFYNSQSETIEDNTIDPVTTEPLDTDTMTDEPTDSYVGLPNQTGYSTPTTQLDTVLLNGVKEAKKINNKNVTDEEAAKEINDQNNKRNDC